MSRVIGIDLGTTNCCVAVLDGGQPTVIANRQGYKTTPSIVAIAEDGGRMVGQVAARQAITNPQHTVFAAKRLIGRPFDSPQVQHALTTMPYRIVAGPSDDVRIELRGKAYSVPEISAMLLQEMRVVAEEHLTERVERAVVTVPAYFNDAQRQAVKDAGRIAGLDVLRILNEPTAAALAYGFGRGEEKRVVVYDLGGGTFDVSIVHVGGDGVFRVLATTGDSFLGGEDFDDRVMAWLIRGFEVQEGIDLRESPIALQRLKQAAQKAKCDLSQVDEAEVQLPFIVSTSPKGPLHMHYSISRGQLEKLTEDLVDRTLDICMHALELARLEATDVDEVVLVGGMTRMPRVQQAVEELFGRRASRNVHPDEVVALGAAIQGAALATEIDEVALEDVTAHSLGIATAGDGYEVIVPASTRVPCRVPSLFTTSRDEQETLRIVVLQGESGVASENELLQDFALVGLRRAPAGDVEVEVEFEIDADGIFRAGAKDLETGEQARVQVLGRSAFEPGELERAAAESAAWLEERRAEEAHEGLRQGLQALLVEVERAAREVEQWRADDPDAVDTVIAVRHAHEAAGRALAADERRALAEHLVVLEDAKEMLDAMLRESTGARR
ncbi:MAG: molecular chaperone DnaK [Myxococcales bacterium]|nr:molecular chaperone DnaK [Myxococcales bacterium]